MSQLAPATRISQQGRVYKTRKAAQGQADFLAGEVDLGWFVLEVTRGHFIVARPYVELELGPPSIRTIQPRAV